MNKSQSKLQWLQKIDQFGVYYIPGIKGESKQYQTIFGGITTLFIYSLSFAFFIYILYQWFSGQILPKVTQTLVVANYIEKIFQKAPYRISLFKNAFQTSEPFDIKNNILTPIFFVISGNDFIGPQTIFTNEKDPIDKDVTKFISQTNLTLRYTDGTQNKKPFQQLLLLLARCVPELLPEGGYCAPNEQIEAFLNMPLNRLTLGVELQQFNTMTQKVETFQKQVYFILDRKANLYSQIIFKTQKSLINDGFLFNHINEYNYISNVEIINQVLTLENLQQFFKFEQYFTFLFRIDSFQDECSITYVQISEILAQVGSIVSILMAFKIIVVFVNQIGLERLLIEEIIGFYYPQFKKLKIIRNYFGRIIRVQKQTLEIYDVEIFKEWYNNAYNIGKKKLNIMNQLFQISRIQIALQSLQHRNLLAQASQIGIPLTIQKKQIKVIPQQSDSSGQISLRQNEEPKDNIYQMIDEDFDLWGNEEEIRYQKIEEFESEKFYAINHFKSQDG